MYMGGYLSNHVCMAINTKDGIFLVEHARHPGKKASESYARIVPIEFYTERDDNFLLARRYKGPPIDSSQILKNMSLLSDRTINMDYANDYMYNNYSLAGNESICSASSLTCAEYIYTLKTKLLGQEHDNGEYTRAYRHLQEKDTDYYDETSDLL